jgi:hypothetical protein
MALPQSALHARAARTPMQPCSCFSLRRAPAAHSVLPAGAVAGKGTAALSARRARPCVVTRRSHEQRSWRTTKRTNEPSTTISGRHVAASLEGNEARDCPPVRQASRCATHSSPLQPLPPGPQRGRDVHARRLPATGDVDSIGQLMACGPAPTPHHDAPTPHHDAPTPHHDASNARRRRH